MTTPANVELAANAAQSSEELTPEAVRRELERVLRSRFFLQSVRLSRYLRFIVEESLRSPAATLKEHWIAVEVFDKPESFDAQTDPIVRVATRRLRAKLRKYYAQPSQAGSVEIALPFRGYIPSYRIRPVGAHDDHIDHNWYVFKDSSSSQLLAAVREPPRGGIDLNPRNLARRFGRRAKNTDRALTARQKQLLKMLAGGQTVKQIASHLELNRKTVETHMLNLMRKLNLNSQAQLVQYAIREIPQAGDRRHTTDKSRVQNANG